MWTKGNPTALLVGTQTGAATVENMEHPQKLKMTLPFPLAIPLLGINPKNPKTSIQKDMHPCVHSSIIYSVICPSGNEWIKKQGYVYTMEY